LAVLLFAGAGFAQITLPVLPEREVLFQVSTLGALLEGNYEGQVTLADLRRHGDFGLGTFEALDGEMCVVNGMVFQVRGDGKVYTPAEQVLASFAVVTSFDPDVTRQVLQPLPDLAALEEFLDGLRVSPNLLCAVKISGEFEYVKTRSVPRQSRPYPPLAEITRQQPTFEFHSVQGDLVGFWLPECLKSLNVSGYHLHFLTADRTGGGHLLEARLKSGTVALDSCAEFRLLLPDQGATAASPDGDMQAEVEQVER